MHYSFTNTRVIVFKKLVYSYSTQILTSTLNILTIFVYVREYSMCVSRIFIAIKCNEFSTKDYKNKEKHREALKISNLNKSAQNSELS